MNLHSMNIKVFITMLVLAFLAFSCNKKKKADNSNHEKIAVKVAIAEMVKQPLIHSFSGNIEAERNSNLSTRLMGQVKKVYVKPGDKVRQGQLLVQISNKDIAAQKAQVEAQKEEAMTALNNAEKDYKRYNALYATQSASEKEMDDIKTHYRMAKARLAAVQQMGKEVEENMHYSSICAPYNGVITKKYVHEGDMANPGMPLLSIESSSKWKVIARIPESDISKIKLNDKVEVVLKSANEKFSGEIIEISPSTGTAGNQYQAKVLVEVPDNCPTKLYSGMYANILFEYGTKEMITVPKKALIHRGQLTGIYSVGQAKNALLHWVRTGKTYGEKVEIISGLKNGEEYILSVDKKLYNGALIANK